MDFEEMEQEFARRLALESPQATLSWLIGILDGFSPEIRSSYAYLVAYTGCSLALNWLEAKVDSPVGANWGQGAALLGASWHLIHAWILAGGSKQLMALDTLLYYRIPRPNISPLAQIVAPVLPQPPTRKGLDSCLDEIPDSQRTPRVKKAILAIREGAEEILTPRQRGVQVGDLPRLFLNPESFPGAGPILARHTSVITSMRQSVQDLLNNKPIGG